MRFVKSSVFMLLILIIFLSLLISAVPPSIGGFSFNPANQSCSSGPWDSPKEIKIIDNRLVGPCNDDETTPNWGSVECCLQVCKNYESSNQKCKLKEEYIQLVESSILPFEEIEKETNSLSTDNEDNTSKILLAVLIIIIVLAVILYLANGKYFKSKKS